MNQDTNPSVQAEAIVPTKFGSFRVVAFAKSNLDAMPHIVLMHPDIDFSMPVTVRIHSECMTGDIFHSLKCDCGEQLDESMRITQQQKGMIIYMRQEGRGIGIINKLRAYQLQENGLDTVESNIRLGFRPDERIYPDAISILKHYGINTIRLITNNPLKIEAIEQGGIKVFERIPVVIPPHPENLQYMLVKREQMGHLI